MFFEWMGLRNEEIKKKTLLLAFEVIEIVQPLRSALVQILLIAQFFIFSLLCLDRSC